jgi:hypothetical protein
LEPAARLLRQAQRLLAASHRDIAKAIEAVAGEVERAGQAGKPGRKRGRGRE